MDIMGGFLFDAVTIIWNNVKVQTMLFMFHSYHFGFHMHNYIYKRILLNTGLMREDPNDSTWCNICTMTDTYALRNHYKFQNFEDEAHKMFKEENKILGSNTVDKFKSDKLWMYKLSNSKTLVYSKFNNGFRNENAKLENLEEDKYPISSVASKFLYVEYIHPDMLEAIELTIPRSMYVVYNELFTPCFVLNILERQDKPYVFDEKYIITIVDKDCKQIELRFNNHISILESSYKHHMLLY